MKKLFPEALARAELIPRLSRLKIYSWIVAILVSGCTTAQVRWDAIGVREQVMKFYNDEIMDNLIRMNQDLPFVHVDVSTVSAAAASQVSGTVGAGETTTFTRNPIGIPGQLLRSVTRPFSYSVTPLKSDTLTVTASPVIGQLTSDAEANTGSSADFVETKRTEVRASEGGAVQSYTTERTPKPGAKPGKITIYDIYEQYGKSLAKNELMASVARPSENDYVPGALRWSGGKFYYIVNRGANKAAYCDLCMALFKQSRNKASAKVLDQAVNEFNDLKARQTVPVSPPK